MARWVELTANSHRFDRAIAALVACAPTPSAAFLSLAAALSERFGREHAIAEADLYEAIAERLRTHGIDPIPVLADDFIASHPGPGSRRKGVPRFLAEAVAARLSTPV
jgi:hypothetical protein